MKYIRCFNCDKPIYTDEEIKIGIVVECPHCGEKYECIDWNGFINRWVRLDETPKENTDNKDKELEKEIKQKIAEYGKNKKLESFVEDFEEFNKREQVPSGEYIEGQIERHIQEILKLFKKLKQDDLSDSMAFLRAIDVMESVISVRRIRRKL